MRLPTGLRVVVDAQSKPWYGVIAGHPEAGTYHVRIGGSSRVVPVRAERLQTLPELDTFHESKLKIIESKGEKEGFGAQDVLGIETLAQDVCRAFAPAKHVFLCLGNSPFPLCYYLETYKDCRVIYMPMSNVECLSLNVTNAHNREITRLTEEAAESGGSESELIEKRYQSKVNEKGGEAKLKQWQLEELREDAEGEIRGQRAELERERAIAIFNLRRSSFQEHFKVPKYLSRFTDYVSRFIDFDELVRKDLGLVVVDFVTSGNAILGVSEGIKALLRKRGEGDARCTTFGLRAAPKLPLKLDACVHIDDDRKRTYANKCLLKVIHETYKKLKLLLCDTGTVNFADLLDKDKAVMPERRSSYILFKLFERARKQLFEAERGFLKFAREDVFGE
ncbi:hypothetical protein D7V97_05155 [Corallococcus sp. CA053C]|uniref:hypothetical protein n=1 Tax=Corallococcus sp. CA053C TaxID=2316732 RepID=UPI000EA054F7|nr:hypothetical protein [Corallococcus sp. CA053C]RKH13604.1 hypothetical protein D7V97_05155 [Corallococcus sp. CA053C]